MPLVQPEDIIQQEQVQHELLKIEDLELRRVIEEHITNAVSKSAPFLKDWTLENMIKRTIKHIGQFRYSHYWDKDRTKSLLELQKAQFMFWPLELEQYKFIDSMVESKQFEYTVAYISGYPGCDYGDFMMQLLLTLKENGYTLNEIEYLIVDSSHGCKSNQKTRTKKSISQCLKAFMYTISDCQSIQTIVMKDGSVFNWRLTDSEYFCSHWDFVDVKFSKECSQELEFNFE